MGFFAIFLSAAFVFILLCGGPVAIYVCIKYKICSGGGATDNNELAEPLTVRSITRSSLLLFLSTGFLHYSLFPHACCHLSLSICTLATTLSQLCLTNFFHMISFSDRKCRVMGARIYRHKLAGKLVLSFPLQLFLHS